MEDKKYTRINLQDLYDNIECYRLHGDIIIDKVYNVENTYMYFPAKENKFYLNLNIRDDGIDLNIYSDSCVIINESNNSIIRYNDVNFIPLIRMNPTLMNIFNTPENIKDLYMYAILPAMDMIYKETFDDIIDKIIKI